MLLPHNLYSLEDLIPVTAVTPKMKPTAVALGRLFLKYERKFPLDEEVEELRYREFIIRKGCVLD